LAVNIKVKKLILSKLIKVPGRTIWIGLANAAAALAASLAAAGPRVSGGDAALLRRGAVAEAAVPARRALAAAAHAAAVLAAGAGARRVVALAEAAVGAAVARALSANAVAAAPAHLRPQQRRLRRQATHLQLHDRGRVALRTAARRTVPDQIKIGKRRSSEQVLWTF